MWPRILLVVRSSAVRPSSPGCWPRNSRPSSVDRPMRCLEVALDSRLMKQTVGTVRCPLLIGRDDLLDLVDRRLDDVIAGRGEFLLAAGEAGVGKSRFLAAVGHKAEERGFDMSWGYVAPQDHDVPAASVLDLARTMVRQPAFAELGRDLLALRERTFEVEQVR